LQGAERKQLTSGRETRTFRFRLRLATDMRDGAAGAHRGKGVSWRLILVHVLWQGEGRRVRGGGSKQRRGGGGGREVVVKLPRQKEAVQRCRGDSPGPWRRVVLKGWSGRGDRRRRGRRRCRKARLSFEPAGFAGASEVGRYAGRGNSIVAGSGEDRVFPTPMYLNRGCCGCRRGCRSSPLSP